jgi:hypothetical protein
MEMMMTDKEKLAYLKNLLEEAGFPDDEVSGSKLIDLMGRFYAEELGE